MKIARENLKEFIYNTNGKIFTIEFVKKNGEHRVMNCRLGVKKYLRGGRNNVTGLDKPYIIVFDLKNKQYRAVNLRTARKIKFKNIEYEVI